MRKTILALASLVLLLVTISAVSKENASKKDAAAARIAQGKYLVDQVAMCGDCHTPFGEKGEPIKEQYLKGTALSFKPIAPMPVWAEKSPNIAGLPGWSKGDAIKFFMTGVAYNGLPGRPPMPRYRFNQADAEAIVAYLQSLAPEKEPK